MEYDLDMFDNFLLRKATKLFRKFSSDSDQVQICMCMNSTLITYIREHHRIVPRLGLNIYSSHFTFSREMKTTETITMENSLNSSQSSWRQHHQHKVSYATVHKI